MVVKVEICTTECLFRNSDVCSSYPSYQNVKKYLEYILKKHEEIVDKPSM